MAKVTYLEFEKPVAQLEEKIQELRDMSSGSEGLDLTSDINGLERKKPNFSRKSSISFLLGRCRFWLAIRIVRTRWITST